MNRHIQTTLLIAVFLMLSSQPLQADIYKYIDSKGVLHFTNMPISSGYQLYIREKPVRNEYLDPDTRFDPYISEASKRYGIDFSLIKALIKVESDFNPKAVSRKGARGLMQLMPKTAQDLGVRDVFDPTQNVEGGARYLRDLLDLHGQDLSLALAAYNAGPTAVARYGGIPPYPETEDYVRKVLELCE